MGLRDTGQVLVVDGQRFHPEGSIIAQRDHWWHPSRNLADTDIRRMFFAIPQDAEISRRNELSPARHVLFEYRQTNGST